jgi:flavin reductase (DIM6/NTAB) family NADH-FMN oxidoreductase RutF
VPKAAAHIHDVEVIGEPFEELMSMLDSPVFVVTTQADGHPSGCVVSFATQVGVQPPRFLVAIAKTNHTFAVASRSSHLAVHALSQRHRGLAELFDGQTADQINKFERCSWRAGPQGMPILDDAVAWFVGRTVNRIDFGDHVGYLLEPAGVWAPESCGDLLYLSDIDDLDPGHEVPQPPRFAEGEQVDKTRRYGVVRFTLDRF